MDLSNENYSTLTKSIDIDESLMLIELTHQIESVSAWQDEALFRLPQASRQRRQEIVRSVQRKFLEVEDDRFLDTPLRKLLVLSVLEPRLKRDLLFGQYLRTTPLVWEAIKEVVLKHAEMGSQPQAKPEDCEIDQEDWDTFLEPRLRQFTDTTFSRTRRHITAHLSKFGLLDTRPLPDNKIGKRFFAHFYDPDPRAFWFYLATEFMEKGWTSRSLAYITTQSWTRVAFCTSEAYARYAIEDAERTALVVSDFFGSDKQITLRGPDPIQRITEAIRYG